MTVSSESPREISNLAEFAPDDWFQRKDESSFWLRIYTVLLVPRERLQFVMDELFASVDKEKPFLSIVKQVIFASGVLADFKIPVFSHDMYADEAGRTFIKVKADQKPLPESTYVFLGTPFKIDGTPGNEHEVKTWLDAAAGLLCLHMGLNSLRDLVFDGEVNAKDGTFSHAGEPWRVPQRCEGPFLGQLNGEDIQEITGRISQLPEPKQGRVRLALKLVNDGMRKMQGFFEYWTALEVICEGRSHRIGERLARLYQLKNYKEAADLFGFTTLEKWRHNYIHRGKTPPFTADVERYIQLLFLDLLRQELGLPLRAHLVGIQRAQGYDLSAIGLADNRTEEQKQAVATVRNEPSKGSGSAESTDQPV